MRLNYDWCKNSLPLNGLLPGLLSMFGPPQPTVIASINLCVVMSSDTVSTLEDFAPRVEKMPCDARTLQRLGQVPRPGIRSRAAHY